MRVPLLRLAVVLPLAGMLVPMLVGFFLPGYSSIHQHMSELELQSPAISMACRVGAFISGLSILGFSLAVVLKGTHRLTFTAVAAFVFGLSMVSNGVFIMGSPLHGLYAIGLAVILVPAFFAAERGGSTDRISLVAAALVLVYMWALMTGLEPAATRGLTQRLVTIPMFGWFGYASLKLLAEEKRAKLAGQTRA
ncbi:DUF998 domain-containing protein [Dyella sp.]|uniref:DUF998 domain-containing protein n=1 Tax=Dyella sp. TaxID=1869338 RepID=UPI002842198D|nr:DUF998 domain-containing protein [Dyella sp.]MDR3447508.1 DUF998 domain-containing protein [Dyella sp.]